MAETGSIGAVAAPKAMATAQVRPGIAQRAAVAAANVTTTVSPTMNSDERPKSDTEDMHPVLPEDDRSYAFPRARLGWPHCASRTGRRR